MELLNYWPRFMQDLIELRQIAGAEQPEIDTAILAVRQAPNDFFLVSLSEYGIERWEAILGLTPAPGETPDERRENIRITYMDRLPYTYRMLLLYLDEVTKGFTVTLDNDAYTLYVEVIVAGYIQRDALMAVLVQMIPANLILVMRTAIPQRVARPAVIAATVMSTMNRHEHIPQGG